MLLSLSIVLGDDVVAVELPEDATLAQLRAAVAAQRPAGGGIGGGSTFVRDGTPLVARSPSATLSSLGVKDGDLLMLIPDEGAVGASGARAGPAAANGGTPSAAAHPPGMPDPATALAALRADPAALAALPPPLQAAVRAGDLETLASAMRLMAAARPSAPPSAATTTTAAAPAGPSPSSAAAERAAAVEAEIDALNADPFDPAAQQRIAELLRQQAVNENMEHAMEHAPEAFGEVVMLYVNLRVNGVPMKAFVDSGAQRSIMSKSAAEKCNILRLLDTRFAGLARGVGAGVINGRVHAVPVILGEKDHVTMSLTVMEQESMPFLFGLDMLRRFQCSIDLSGGGGGFLRFPTLGVSLPFLSEHEIPRSERFEGAEEKAAAAASNSAAAAEAAGGGAAVGTTTNGAPSVAATAADPEKVAKLAALGFDPEAAARALVSTGGNEELAAQMLFGDT